MLVNRIHNVSGKLTEEELLIVGTLCLKAGYAVTISKKKVDNKYIKYVEFKANLEGLEDGHS